MHQQDIDRPVLVYFEGNSVFSVKAYDRSSLLPLGDSLFYLSKNGFFKLEPTENRITSIAERTWNNITTYSPLADEQGIWFGTYNGGLGFYDFEADSVQYWGMDAKKANGLATNRVVSLAKDKNDKLWLATDGGGLCWFDQETAYFNCYNTDNSEIPHNATASIEIDQKGILWVGTHNGITRFDPETEIFTNFDVGDGLPSDYYYYDASSQNEAGIMVFGGDNGFVYIDPDKVNPSTYQAPMAMTQIVTGDSLYWKIPGEKIELAYDQNSISFNFVALDLTDPTRNYYKYALAVNDPNSSNWIEIGHKAEMDFRNLAAGDYVFKVTGANHDRVWSTDTLKVRFAINKHWAQTAWFWGLISILVGSIVAGVIVFYAYLLVKERAREEKERQALRTRIAGDLHDEVGGRVGGISVATKMVANSLEEGSFNANILHRATSSADELGNEVRDIIWMINPEYDSVELMIGKMDAYVQTLMLGKTYNFVPPEKEIGDRLNMVNRRHIYLLFKEALHNIHRHADAQNVDIIFSATDDSLVLTIQDDGIGFDTKNPGGSGTGLLSYQNRAQAMNGTLDIESSAGGGGTTLVLVVPLSQEKEDVSWPKQIMLEIFRNIYAFRKSSTTPDEAEDTIVEIHED